MVTKALFLSGEWPYDDMGELVEIARAEATKILGTDKIKVLNILSCSYPIGYVVVVQNPGGKGGTKRKNK